MNSRSKPGSFFPGSDSTSQAALSRNQERKILAYCTNSFRKSAAPSGSRIIKRSITEDPQEAMSSLLQSPTATPGRFGPYGGRYVPETLMVPLFELERAYELAKTDPSFQAQFQDLLKNFAGRPTPLQFASRLTAHLGGPRIYVKREDLLHTGAHKINNCLGQGLLAVRMGKRRIIAETGAGQHGVPTATVAARLGLECDV